MSGKLRILVVEDDPSALTTTTGALQALGHFAAGASSAEVARSRFLDGAFDVLITDIGLPGLSGDELVQTIRQSARSPLEVIFATGQPRPPGNNAIWLQKPYRLEDLEAALESARQSLRKTCASDGKVAQPQGC
ncbi:response regulator [Variovorax dokdonensis]|uniref:Response regulator n=2 Tax=Variovorax dokdonensis TaxID=344883 RepID=A0ABT7NDC2_9BURK|nr:response regulator [Variovorax dokdonensis]MDM0045921.1 response regulator [Variovorax dokdonensis]